MRTLAPPRGDARRPGAFAERRAARHLRRGDRLESGAFKRGLDGRQEEKAHRVRLGELLLRAAVLLSDAHRVAHVHAVLALPQRGLRAPRQIERGILQVLEPNFRLLREHGRAVPEIEYETAFRTQE